MAEASEIWKEIKPKIGEMLMAVNDIETRAEKAQEEAFKNGYDAACKDIDIKSKTNAAYQKGLEDAWEAARKIASDNSGRNYSIFGQHFTVEILNTHSASECIEKIRQYEQEKEEIKIGDEVSLKSGAKGFVTRMVMFGDEQISAYVVWSDGYVGSYNLDGLQKTGKHYSEIAEVMQKMKEGE